MKVLNFGSLNLDYVYRLKDFPLPGETITSLSHSKYCGGKGLNQSIALRRSGLTVYHAGMVGPDGECLRQLLQEEGVDTTHIGTASQVTGHAIIQVNKKGQNCIILFQGANYQIQDQMIEQVLQEFGPRDILVLQNEINHLDHIITAAHQRGMIILFNPAPFSPQVLSLPLDEVDYFILNETEAQGFAQTEGTQAAVEKLQQSYPHKHIIVTLGEYGSCYLHNGQAVFSGIYDVPVVDTTAAGDTFIGYLVHGIVTQQDMAHTLQFAAKASALAVMQAGASVSIPTLSQVEEADLPYRPFEGFPPDMENEQ